MNNKIKILVVDDEITSLSKIYINFLLKDYNTEVTMDANEVRPRMLRMVPHIVIINTDIPPFNGHEICEIIKTNLETSLILLLGPGSTSTLQLDGCSADEIVMKPVNTAHLTSVVNRLFERKRAKSLC